MEEDDEKHLLSVLGGRAITPPPVWLMRQAGRYLPEYREVRAKAGSFWSMCMDPKTAVEITLQPIRRFGFDAAIIFSDILTVPYALGRRVEFIEGKGPTLQPLNAISELETRSEVWRARLEPAYEALRLARLALDPDTALLGFAGAPWTLATYVVAGRGGDEQRAAKLWGYRNPESFELLLDLIGDCVAQHLIWQVEAGADIVQIFDSWAGGLPEAFYAKWVVHPTRRVIDKVREVHPSAKIIGFPRASSLAGYSLYAIGTHVDAVGIDTGSPISWMRDFAQAMPVQGNLDPMLLLAGGKALHEAVDEILREMRGRPFIFNLGHGVLPETPPEHVAQLVARVRAAR